MTQKSNLEEKHLSIVGAIERLESAEAQLRKLLEKITGIETPKEAEEACNVPTLAGLLNNAGKEITQKAERIISLTGEIEACLF